MGKKKSKRPAGPLKQPAGEAATTGWTVNSQSAIVTIWERQDDTGSAAYAVTFNQKRQPVPPPDDEKGARSVMLAFQKLERADSLKKADDIGID